MAASVKDILADIFNVPTDGSNINSEDTEGGSDVSYSDALQTNAEESFEIKAQRVSEAIEAVSPPQSPPESEPEAEKEVISEIKGAQSESLNKEEANNKGDSNGSPTQGSNTNGGFEQLLKDAICPKTPNKCPVQSLDREPPFDTIPAVLGSDDDDKKALPNIPKNLPMAEQKTLNTDSFWKIETDQLAFAGFYALKKEKIPRLLIGGMLQFDGIENELLSARVDISNIDIKNTDILAEKMYEIEKWRERVNFMQIKINKQYYLWKRFIELFHGSLARAFYDKPIEKNKGLILEHMDDMETYFARLESVFKSAECVHKNLEAAYECLSRLVTIALPHKEIERYRQDTTQKTPNNACKVENNSVKKLRDFDSLDDISNTANNSRKEVEADNDSLKNNDLNGWLS